MELKIAKELLVVARLLSADDAVVEKKDSPEKQELIKQIESGQYKWVAVFPGKSRAAPGNRPKQITEIKGHNMVGVREHIEKVVYDVKHLEVKENAMIVQVIGNLGKPDVYVFTKLPYEEVFPSTAKPVKKVSDIRETFAARLREKGLRSLGMRSGKSGDQYGLPDSARRVAIGSREIMANFLQVQDQSNPASGDGRRLQDSRWGMFKNFLISKTDDKIIDLLVEWVKKGPTMVEVREMAHQRRMLNIENNPGKSGYEIGYGIARGTEKKDAAVEKFSQEVQV